MGNDAPGDVGIRSHSLSRAHAGTHILQQSPKDHWPWQEGGCKRVSLHPYASLSIIPNRNEHNKGLKVFVMLNARALILGSLAIILHKCEGKSESNREYFPFCCEYIELELGQYSQYLQFLRHVTYVFPP